MREYVSIAEETSKAARSDQKAALPYRGLNLCNIDTSQTSLTLALTQRDIDANHIVDGIREQIGKKGRPAMNEITNALYAEIDKLTKRVGSWRPRTSGLWMKSEILNGRYIGH